MSAGRSENNNDNEHIPYPKSIFLIIASEFCERFCFHGMRTLLSIYLRDILLFRENRAKVIYHAFCALAYLFPMFGAIISDGFIGKFKTILYLSFVYAIGNVVLSLTATKPIGLPQEGFTIFSLVLIAIGTGGIKPCVSAFGGDQFVLPQQQRHLDLFFSTFYFTINLGSLSSTIVTPVLRKQHCFGEHSCYPLAFFMPGLLMVIALVIFASGKRLYRYINPHFNAILLWAHCLLYGLQRRIRGTERVDHWLDRTEEKFDKKFVEEVKSTLSVLLLLTTIPIFWTLFDQQGSGWVFLAARMNGDLGAITLLPEHMNIVNPILIIVLNPLFAYVIYPCLGKCHILSKPLQRMVCGGLLTALSFSFAAVISLSLEQASPKLPKSGESHIRIYNTLDCKASISAEPFIHEETVDSMDYRKFEAINIKGMEELHFEVDGCEDILEDLILLDYKIKERHSYMCYLHRLGLTCDEDDIEKAHTGKPKVRTLVDDPESKDSIVYSKDKFHPFVMSAGNYSTQLIHPLRYKVINTRVTFRLGGVYAVLINLDNKKVKSYTITDENKLHMFWLLPQYIVITMGEIMLSVTGNRFCYTQAPTNLKSLMTACWHLTNAVGNLFVVIIEALIEFERQSWNFFLYSGLMFVDMFIFALLATRYKYVPVNGAENGAD